jgi:hypothetical protein
VSHATPRFPDLEPDAFAATRNALHSYSRVLGEWMSACRPKRKHWWHASLRPSLNGLTTGVLRAGVDFELQLDLRESRLSGKTSNGDQLMEELHGQSAADFAARIRDFLIVAGVEKERLPKEGQHGHEQHPGYSPGQARAITHALASVNSAMESFRAGVREETSPIQFWPHHFDLAMLWLPGDKVSGQDPKNEEYADKQMNFGFTLGDEGIPEPYFYVTAHPLPEAMPGLPLPSGTVWQTDGFSGAVLRYRSLLQEADPDTYLINLWNGLLSAGREHMSCDGN